MAKNKKLIIQRICEEFAKCFGSNATEGILEISLADYIEYIKWDCENLCLYNPNFINPPPIVGLKVELKKEGELKIKKSLNKDKK